MNVRSQAPGHADPALKAEPHSTDCGDCGDAGTIKRPGISVADAIIAASARSVNASVVTNDPHFSKMGVEVTGYP